MNDLERFICQASFHLDRAAKATESAVVRAEIARMQVELGKLLGMSMEERDSGVYTKHD